MLVAAATATAIATATGLVAALVVLRTRLGRHAAARHDGAGRARAAVRGHRRAPGARPRQDRRLRGDGADRPRPTSPSWSSRASSAPRIARSSPRSSSDSRSPERSGPADRGPRLWHSRGMGKGVAAAAAAVLAVGCLVRSGPSPVEADRRVSERGAARGGREQARHVARDSVGRGSAGGMDRRVRRPPAPEPTADPWAPHGAVRGDVRARLRGDRSARRP